MEEDGVIIIFAYNISLYGGSKEKDGESKEKDGGAIDRREE